MKTKKHYTYSEPESEHNAEKVNSKMEKLAAILGELFGKKNLPKLKGDNLGAYIGQIKHAFEEVSAFMHRRVQPDSHMPQAGLKLERAKEKDKQTGNEIEAKESDIHNETFKLGQYHPSFFILRFFLAILFTVTLFSGDTSLNIRAFEYLGGSYLRAFSLAISCSVALFILSHVTPLLIKATRDRIKRRQIIIASLVLAFGVSLTFSVLRSKMLANQNMSVSPIWFVVLNMFLFIIATAVSFWLMPTWQEFNEHMHNLGKWLRIKNDEKHVGKLKVKKENDKDRAFEESMEHYKIVVYAKHFDDHIIRMYRKCVQIFINANLMARTDGGVPDCFHNGHDDPDTGFTPTDIINPNKTLS